MMKVKSLVAFKSKLSSPCRKLLVLLKLKKPLYVRPRGPRSSHAKTKVPAKQRVRALFSGCHSHKQSKKMDRVKELRSLSDAGREMLISPLPLTPASARKGKVAAEDVVEDACRSFENYLLEMIVEEGNVKDLMDVEELLYCWKNLKSPVFAELVSRFYGELCRDLFSHEED